jgi:hypothetical protein
VEVLDQVSIDVTETGHWGTIEDRWMAPRGSEHEMTHYWAMKAVFGYKAIVWMVHLR